MLAIDIIEGCNFKCYFCPASEVEQNIYMDLDLFKRIVLEAEELGIRYIDLVPLKGEPFLHPDIYEMIDFADKHVERVNIISNGSAINAKKLSTINRKSLHLSISWYGSTPERFKELTCTTDQLFKIVHRKVEDLKNYGIPFEIARRDVGRVFNYNQFETRKKFDGPKKCDHHQRPRIAPTGKVTYCEMLPGRTNYVDDIYFADLNTESLKEALTNPLRYKFFESESICRKHCFDVSETCISKPTLPMYKLMFDARKKYEDDVEKVDAQYKILEALADSEVLKGSEIYDKR
jgi:MoaA/NifB/PqqE/SkfB family radical SAM enzyme